MSCASAPASGSRSRTVCPRVCTRARRPCTQATDASPLLPLGLARSRITCSSPSPLSTFMQIRMGQRGWRAAPRGPVLHGVTLATWRPPRPCLHLLQKFADLSPPIGGAAQDFRRTSPASWRETPTSLTRSPISRSTSRTGEGLPLPDSVSLSAGGEEKNPKDIGDVAWPGRPRAPRMRRSSPFSVPRASKNPWKPLPDTIEDVLARIEARRNGRGSGLSAPRHRASLRPPNPREEFTRACRESVGLRVAHLRVRQRRRAPDPARQLGRPRDAGWEGELIAGPDRSTSTTSAALARATTLPRRPPPHLLRVLGWMPRVETRPAGRLRPGVGEARARN